MAAPDWTPDRLDALNRLTTVARLLSTAVHDTGNSLQIISGHAEMIVARTEDAEKIRTRARTIKTHTDQASVRLQGLVALARSESGPSARVLLRAIAERAVEMRRYTLARQQIAVTIAEGGADVAVRAAETTLLRLVANLVLDAEDAVHGRSGGAIRIEIGHDAAHASLRVVNNGPPLSDEERSRLFEPFARAADPWASLAAARALAITLGGTLDAERDAASGIALRLELPLTT